MATLWKRLSSVWQRPELRRAARGRKRTLLFDILESRTVLSATTPIITEFLASNNGGFRDEDGAAGDWIEIYNPTLDPVNLGGWSLTDDAADLNKWQFPQITIEPDQFIVVFADGKNRTTGPILHTNFSISSAGEYLALVNTAGTVVSEYTPQFPEQRENISYGTRMDSTDLVPIGATAQTRVPTSNIGTTWRQVNFTPTGWTTGGTGIGFGLLQPGFNVTYIKANRSIDNLATAKLVLQDDTYWSNAVYTTTPTINFLGNGGSGRFGSDVAFPTQQIGQDYDWFLIQATGQVTIPTSGNWSFLVNSDDGFELRLERNGVVFTSSFDGIRTSADTVATFNIPAAGEWNVTLLAYENTGGASVELAAVSGATSTYNTSFRLIGQSGSTSALKVNSVPGATGGLTIGTNVSTAMLNQNATAYIRVPFTVANPAAFDELHLDMLYDDGFVAYLNGVEVARRNAPATLSFNSTATADRSIDDVVVSERINLTGFLGNLLTGNNVLAIQGLNSSASDASFLIMPKLTASRIYTDQLRYFQTPSPGIENTAPSLGIVGDVVASVPAGFYSAPITVALSSPTPGVTIRYTTNGSNPTATTGTVYTGPLTISATTVLRAQAFLTGYIPQFSGTWTYLFLDDVILQSPSDDITGGYPATGVAPAGWPTTWGSNVVDYGMDQTIVNSAGAAQVKAALQAISTISISTDLSNLFNSSTGIYANASGDGREWERPASVEMINPDGSPGFQINAGVRIRGGYSRSTDNPKHAFRLFFRDEYGESDLDYPLFGNGPGVVTSFKKFDLRTAQNYSWSFGGDGSMTMIQDGFARQSQLDMGQPSTHSRWVHLYLDGQYWGIYQIEERPEADFAASYFGGVDDDYDVVKVDAGPYSIYATNGDLDAYRRLWTAVSTQNLSLAANYYRLQGKDASGIDDLSIPNSDVLLDVDNLITYMIGIFHGGNLDAPISAFLGNTRVNNFFAIRNRNGREGFKYIQHDAEHTLLNVNENRMGPYSTAGFDYFNPQYLHQRLMANVEYRMRFADLVQKNFLNNGPMSVAKAQARYQADVNALNTAIIAESARWGDSKRPTSPLTRNNWLSAVSFQRDNFLVNRHNVILQQFRSAGLLPNLDAPTFLVNGIAQNSGQVIPGSLLRFTAPTGLVYYTTDGSDPRLLGGGINPNAQVFNGTGAFTNIITANSSWRYYDAGGDLGTTWRTSSYTETAAWKTGNAELGYGDGDEATVVSYGPNASAKYITTYFRKTFSIVDPSTIPGLLLRLKRDDGAVVYINGVEVARSNMPGSTVTATTPANSAVGNADETTFFEYVVSPSLLVAGQNLIAVEVHQSDAASTDLSFDLQLVSTNQANFALLLNNSKQLKARTLNGTIWSPIVQASLSTAIPAAAGNLVVTEMYYHPAQEPGAPPPFDNEENYEFIEVRNIGTQTIELANVRFTSGITFNFSSGDVPFLQPGESAVVVAYLSAFERRFGTSGIRVAGVYAGNLNNGGETITLTAADNSIIQSFTYDDVAPWPTSPDGAGPSLTVVDVNGNYNSPTNWRPSYGPHGTPGGEEPFIPNPPTGLAASLTGFIATSTAPTPISNLLTWTREIGTASYRVERKVGVGGIFTEIGVVSSPSLTDAGLVAGTTYYYRVRGFNVNGTSGYSPEFSITTPDAPAAPSNLQVTNTTISSISLRWNDNSEIENGFQIYRSAAGGAFTLIASLPASLPNAPASVSYTDTGLAGGVTYTYEIRSFNIAGTSGAASTSALATNSTTTILVVSPPNTIAGNLVQMTAAVSPLPNTTGTVTFYDNGEVLAANVPVEANGQASYSTTTLSVGSHSITAQFNGSTGYLPSTSVAKSVVINYPLASVSGVLPSSGSIAGGNAVVITGMNLTGALAVKFGGVAAASYVVDSPTQITAISPPGVVGTVNITVTNPDGIESMVSALSLYTYLGAPVFSSMSPTNGPSVGGRVITLIGSNFTGATAVMFGANPATSFTILSDTQISAVSPAGTGTVRVSVSNPGGTNVPTVTDQFSYLASPVVASLSPSRGPLAGGTIVTINGSAFAGATSVKFGTQNATFTVNSLTRITATAPAGLALGPVDVTVTTPNGGTSLVTVNSQFTYGDLPAISAPTVADLTSTSATLGGTVTLEGASTPTRGIVYSLTSANPNPTIGGAGVVNLAAGSGLGTFTAAAASLTPGVSYSFAAYATNAVGTVYTTVTTFITPKVGTTTTLSAGTPNPSTGGQIVQFDVSVSAYDNVPQNGVVSLRDSNNVEISSLTLVNGTGSFHVSNFTPGAYTLHAVYLGTSIYDTSTSATVTQSVAPSLVSNTLNGGTPELLNLPSPYTNQRSMVRSFQLTFDTPVTLAPGAVGIAPVATFGAIPGSIVLLNSSGGTSADTIWNVTFGGANTHGGSLADGLYNLTVDPSKVTSSAGLHLLSAPAPYEFYVLFGDADGNRTVNAVDIVNARREANTTSAAADYLWFFDYDWNGTISNTDIIQARRNSNKTA
jgi:hypothetical protein